MDRLDAMHMFVRVVETGSFTKVAQEFATTQPTVTKQVAAMEARLKVRLLNRNTRGVSMTEAGALYYEKCKIIVADVDLNDLQTNRLNGTTIPLYDKRKDVYDNPVDVVKVA